MSTRIKIEPPSQLPSSGVTAIKYKQWKIALKIFMTQTPEFREFYPGGNYTTWSPYEDNPHRIQQLADNDAVPENTTAGEHLAQRRIHLETFLGIIARYSDEGDFDDIVEKSSSLEWIHQLHERRYGLQNKGRYFHRFDAIRFDKSTMTDYYKFYTDLRSCFKSNMRKTGDHIKYKNVKLTEDEKLTPTTECLLITIALERIDPRLPSEIDRIFGHQMDDSTTLIDLQSEIFSYIPRALESLDREEQTACNAQCINHVHEVHNTQPHCDINAMQSRRYQPRTQKPNSFQRSIPVQRPAKPYNQRQIKFCKICQALDLSPLQFTSHNTNDCYRKTLLQEMQVQDEDYEAQIDDTPEHEAHND